MSTAYHSKKLQELAGKDYSFLEKAYDKWEVFKSVYHSFDRIRDHAYKLPKSEQKPFLEKIKEYLNEISLVDCKTVYNRINDIRAKNPTFIINYDYYFLKQNESLIDELEYFEGRFNLLYNSIIDVSIGEEKSDPAPEQLFRENEISEKYWPLLKSFLSIFEDADIIVFESKNKIYRILSSEGKYKIYQAWQIVLKRKIDKSDFANLFVYDNKDYDIESVTSNRTQSTKEENQLPQQIQDKLRTLQI